MDKAASAFVASKYAMKRPVDEFDRYQDVLSDTNNYIIKVFRDLIEDQYALSIKNGVLGVNISEILYINVGNSIIYTTRDTLTYIKGKRTEYLFIGWQEKILQRDDGGRVLMKVKFRLFHAVLDCLNKCNIAPLNSSL